MTLNTPCISPGGGLRRPYTRVLGAALLLVLLTGCSGAGPGGAPAASGGTAVASGSGFSSGTAIPSAPAPAASNAGLPGTNLTLTGGSAQVSVTGDASLTMALALTSGILIPGTNVVMVWSGSGDEGRDDTLRIQAPSQTGTYTSSATDFAAPDVSLSTGRIGNAGVPAYMTPEADECTVTLTKVDATGVAGSLQCSGLISGQDQTVDVSAEFTATP